MKRAQVPPPKKAPAKPAGKVAKPASSSSDVKPAKKGNAPTLSDNIERFFLEYANQTQTEIDFEGLNRLCADLRINPMSDVEMLVLVWKCQIKQPGVISREEFINGMTAIRADSVDVLRQRLDGLRVFAQDPFSNEYRSFFRFVFDLTKEPGAKNIDSNDATAILNLLLVPRFKWMPRFIEYLGVRAQRFVNLDQ